MTTATQRIVPMSHQDKALEIARTHPRFAFFWEPGAGKTIAMYLIQHERPMPTLIICTKAIMRAAWEADAELMRTNCHIIHGTPAKRRNKMDHMLESIVAGENPIIVTNFETFRNKEFHAWAMNAFKGDGRFIVDESSKLKNYKSIITQKAIEFSKVVAECYLLSGTPAPNGPEEYWPQLRCLDDSPGGLADSPGSKQFPFFFRWANHYLAPLQRSFKGRTVTVGWKIREKRKNEFARLLDSCSWTIGSDDLPFELKQPRNIPYRLDLGNERKMYDQVESDLKACFDGNNISVAVQAQVMKLRQITGGHFYVNQQNDDTRIEHVGSTKLAATQEIIETLKPDEPLIIWAEFRAEIESLTTLCRLIGRKTWRLFGGSDHDNGHQAVAFQKNQCWLEPGKPAANVLICHPQSVAHGVTFTRARYNIFYSFAFSWEYHKQARMRTLRKGQDAQCVYWYLIARDTIDENIMRVLGRKHKTADATAQAVREICSR